jgi:hypothetical protein
MIPDLKRELVRLVWRPEGVTPGSEAFDEPDAESWDDGAEAVRDAVGRKDRGEAQGEPWLRIGETIYDPGQVRTLLNSNLERQAGADEAAPGDEPWE